MMITDQLEIEVIIILKGMFILKLELINFVGILYHKNFKRALYVRLFSKC